VRWCAKNTLEYSVLSGCTRLAGAIRNIYTPSERDVGRPIDLRVTARNSYGSVAV
jgi:hypothetical protein